MILITILTILISRIKIRFKDRMAAGSILGEILKSKYANSQGVRSEIPIVVGIPGGGVIIANMVAKKLCADFEILVGRKLGEPYFRDKAIGAIVEGGTTYLNLDRIKDLHISPEYIETEKSEQEQEVKLRTSMYRCGGKLTMNFRDRIVILTDDGADTGATLIAAATLIMKQKPKSLVIALPVAPKWVVSLLRRYVHDVQVILTPSSDFYNLGQYYVNFVPVRHQDVMEIIHKHFPP